MIDRLIGIVGASILILGMSGPANSGMLKEEVQEDPGRQIRMTILYDNYSAEKEVRTDWGFACLIEGLDQTILFDTGTQTDILEHNAGLLGVDFGTVDIIVISHLHGDHTGGLPAVLEKKKGIPVYLPGTAPARLLDAQKELIVRGGSIPYPVKDPTEICTNVWLTGSLPGEGGPANDEQGLVIDTNRGLVVVTGCAHPGIVRIVRRAAEIRSKKSSVVMGGFHLGAKSETQVLEIIGELKSAGVVRCGASHCTGDRAIELFKRKFGRNFLSLGAGRVVTLAK